MKHVTQIVNDITIQTQAMLEKHLPNLDSHISYCAIFCRDYNEFELLNSELLGSSAVLANDTATGPVYVVNAITTPAGPLRIIKVRRPDPTRRERGDSDYAVSAYDELKASLEGVPGHNLIVRDEFEMIELIDDEFDCRVYFSNPPVEDHLGIHEALQKIIKFKAVTIRLVH